MIQEIYGKKIGMTQIFDKEGNLLPITLLEVEPVCLLEKVTTSGAKKVKIGCFKVKEGQHKKVKKPLLGYFDKLKVSPYKLIREVFLQEGVDFSLDNDSKANSPVKNKDEQKQEDGESVALEQATDKENSENIDSEKENIKEFNGAASSKEPSDPRQVGVDIFNIGDVVDIRAKTKGKGFAGGMKRWGWKGQPRSHGSTSHRRLGSAGASAYPSKIIKGLHMPGHMGNVFRTIKNLKILKIDKERNLIFVSGSMPGSRGAVVRIRKVNPGRKLSW